MIHKSIAWPKGKLRQDCRLFESFGHAGSDSPRFPATSVSGINHQRNDDWVLVSNSSQVVGHSAVIVS